MDKRQKVKLAALLLVKNHQLLDRKLQLILLKLIHNVKIIRAIATTNMSLLQNVGIALGHSEIRERHIWKFERNNTFWERDVPTMDDSRFKEQFRMNRKTFQKVCESVRSMKRTDTNMRLCIPLDKRVAIALFALGSSAEYRTVGSLFGVGRSTVGEILIEFCNAVCNNLQQYINSYPPSSQEVEHIVNGFKQLGFPQCFGAVDGCHIEVQPKNRMQ